MPVFCFFFLFSGPNSSVERVDEIMHLTPEMIQLIEEKIGSNMGAKQKLYALIDLIFSEEELGLIYGNNRTKTAAETFETREGNCLSFTSMFVAMARHVGIPARFQEVLDVSTFNKRGNVVVNNKHMNVSISIHGRTMVVDFQPESSMKKHLSRVINDEEAFAHFYNNKGAEAYSRGQYDLAMSYFQAAVEVEPDFSRTYSNRGVLLKRLGQLEEAEKSYLKAIELNKHEYTAMSNLVQLYELQGKHGKARKYERKVERHRKSNPYYHYALGLDEYEQDHYKDSIDHFKRALRIHPKESDFYHALARSYWQMGESKNAKRYWELAERFALDPDDRQRYNSKLDALVANK